VLPNFFVIGANKAGTTSLHRYLSEHPDVFMSAVKEPHWFVCEGVIPEATRFRGQMERVPTYAAYEALFDGVRGERVVGESSTGYLTNPVAARRIKAAVPEARLLAVIRDPSGRAHSAHAHARREGKEPIASFAAALDEERRGCPWRGYVRFGRYAEGLACYFELFGRDQVKVFLYEDLCDDPKAMLGETFVWLGLDPTFTPPVEQRYNVSYVPKSAAVHRALRRSSRIKSTMKAVLPASTLGRIKHRVGAWNTGAPEPLDTETRARLIELFDADIRATEALVGRDLSSWRTV